MPDHAADGGQISAKNDHIQTTPARTPARRSHRPPGREWRILAWLARHPLFALHPTIGAGTAVVFGLLPTVAVYGALAALVIVWWRAHPAFDRYVAPRVWSVWRRWTCYRGGR